MTSVAPPEKHIVLRPPKIVDDVFPYNNFWYAIHPDCNNITNKFLQDRSPLLIDDEIGEANPGIYVWVIANDVNGITHLYAKRTLMRQEIQTKHSNLLIEIGTITVLCAGEFTIDTKKNLRFNYESGTVMQNAQQMTSENTTFVIEIFEKYSKKNVVYDSFSLMIYGMQMDATMLKDIENACPGNLYRFKTESGALGLLSNVIRNKHLADGQQPIDITKRYSNYLIENITRQTRSKTKILKKYFEGGSKKNKRTRRRTKQLRMK